jgi:WD40 repeat protein
VTLPAPPDGYRIYIPSLVSADPVDHVAMVLQAANPPGCGSNNPQLASFTADSKGNLTTTNTSATMPTTLIPYVNDLKMSPSGKLLAVAGTNGVQVFHFNGANPPTAYTPLLTTDSITQTFWDNDNHLLAIDQADGRLHVFNVTATSYSEAPGSPYAVSQPEAIAVQSKTQVVF